MNELVKSLLLVTTIVLCFAFLGCTAATETPGEPAAEDPAESGLPGEEPAAAEDEAPVEETTKSSTQVTTTGSGFQHTVKMEIDGVVETGENEGWWEVD